MGNHQCKQEGGRGAWSHNAVIFHGNAGKKLRRHTKSKPHADAILAITSTRIDEALSRPIGIQGKISALNEKYKSRYKTQKCF